VTATTQGEPCTLPADVQVALYRMAQEALSNVVKHAQARNATVDLRYLPDGGLTLCIDDDGHGFDAGSIPAGHLGVSIMRERATSVGATLDVDSRPGHGTHVSIGWTPG
jgi:signal transduction histidine kinase